MSSASLLQKRRRSQDLTAHEQPQGSLVPTNGFASAFGAAQPLQNADDEQQREAKRRRVAEPVATQLLRHVASKIAPNDAINTFSSHTILKTLVKQRDGGSDPLDEVHIFSGRDDATGEQYWLYTTAGLSEMHVLEQNGDAADGHSTMQDDARGQQTDSFGFELCFRLRRQPFEQQQTTQQNNLYIAPRWPRTLFQEVARYVTSTGNTFADGDFLPYRLRDGIIRPYLEQRKKQLQNLVNQLKIENIYPDQSILDELAFCDDVVALNSFLVRQDPVLGVCETSVGRIVFLQFVPVTDDELDAARKWFTRDFMQLMADRCPVGRPSRTTQTLPTRNPLLIADVSRGSVLADLDIKQAYEQALTSQGSSAGLVFGDLVEWNVQELGQAQAPPGITSSKPRLSRIEVTLAIDDALHAKSTLVYRIPFYREFIVASRERLVSFYPLHELQVRERSDGQPLVAAQQANDEQRREQEDGACFAFLLSVDNLVIKCNNKFARAFSSTDFRPGGTYQWREFPALTVRCVQSHSSQVADEYVGSVR